MENIENALIAGLRAMLKVLAPQPPKGEDGNPESNEESNEESTESTEVTNSPEGSTPTSEDGVSKPENEKEEATVQKASAGFRRFRF